MRYGLGTFGVESQQMHKSNYPDLTLGRLRKRGAATRPLGRVPMPTLDRTGQDFPISRTRSPYPGRVGLGKFMVLPIYRFHSMCSTSLSPTRGRSLEVVSFRRWTQCSTPIAFFFVPTISSPNDVLPIKLLVVSVAFQSLWPLMGLSSSHSSDFEIPLDQ